MDQVLHRKVRVRFGVVARATPFWEWSEGRGLEHAWTVIPADKTRNDIAERLRLEPVEVLFFENNILATHHPAWRDPVLQVMAWYRGRSPRAPPEGWTIQAATFRHWELGGVTDGVFTVRVAMRQELRESQPRKPLGPEVTLSQVLNPTVLGKPSSLEVWSHGSKNTAQGLLSFERRHGRVLAPSVTTKSEYVERLLTTGELLAALDVPGERVKGAGKEAAERWKEELKLPFKVRGEVCEWLYELLASPAVAATGGGASDYSNPRKRRIEMTEGSPQHKRPWADPELTSTGTGASLTEEPHKKDTQANQKAAKHDDAEVPVSLWNERARAGSGVMLTDGQLDRIRECLLRYWKRLVARDFGHWCRKQREGARVLGQPINTEWIRTGASALRFAADATWWDWPSGSAPFFWRWAEEYQEVIRDGLPPRFTGEPPKYRTPQRLNKDPKQHEWERNKVAKARRKSYIAPSRVPVDSLMSFFSVPKVTVYHEETGTEEVLDIRMVYNGSSCGLNAVIWAPWFALPTGDQMTRTLEEGYWGADNDYGEMFYNFWLHANLRRYSGVDLTVHFPEELKGTNKSVLWEVWTRPAMGLRPSPYQSVQGALVVKRQALGEPSDEGNVYRWNALELNLPGNESYVPSRPWISKRRQDGSLAADIHSYVDDERITGPTREETWAGSSKLAKLRAYLGLQDAARKRREPSQEPGPWAGVVAHSRRGEPVYKLVTQIRWDKARRLLGEIREMFDRGVSQGRETTTKNRSKDVWLQRDKLESARGFLVYVARTYTTMLPYLKGLHLTIDSWRPNRDEEGWRLGKEGSDEVDPTVNPDNAPARVKAVPRLANDLRALEELTAAKEPPRVRVRPTTSAAVAFIFGDASGAGFGQSLWLLGEDDVDVFYGTWDEWAAQHSSNWREFYNQVLAIERGIADGTIPKGTEIFMFTDNFVTERAYFRGTSKSKELFDLVLRLRRLEMTGELFIHLIWVAGTRMIAQGTDGVSRGDLRSGVLSGRAMLQYVPLNLGVASRSPELVEWFSGAAGDQWTCLEPREWYHQVHTSDGNYVWCPPPAVADVALEQLCETRHTRPWNSHMFLCPALMTSRWRKRLGKVADAMFTVPVGSKLWRTEMHEPVVVALICPLLSCRPWQVRDTALVDELRDQVSGMWSPDLEREWTSMRKFWTGAREWNSV